MPYSSRDYELLNFVQALYFSKLLKKRDKKYLHDYKEKR